MTWNQLKNAGVSTLNAVLAARNFDRLRFSSLFSFMAKAAAGRAMAKRVPSSDSVLDGVPQMFQVKEITNWSL